MNKLDLSTYLTNLSFILEAQEKMGVERSKTIATEYAARFEEFKDLLKKEQEDETGQSNNLNDGVNEARAGQPRR